MTVETPYIPLLSVGNGTTTSFPVLWPFAEPADVDVELVVLSTGLPLSPKPVLNGAGANDYAIIGTTDADTGMYVSASVVFNAAPSALYNVFRGRVTADVQDKQLPTNGRFPAGAVEGGLDRRTIRSQENFEMLLRAIVAPAIDGPLDMELPVGIARGGRFLVFDPATFEPVASEISEADLGAILALLQVGSPVDGAPNVVQLSKSVVLGLTLGQADAVAAAAGYQLSIDQNYVLTENTTINSKTMRDDGGVITLGNFNLIANGCYITAGPSRIFAYTGTGRLTGTSHNTAIYPEWFGPPADAAIIQHAVDHVEQSLGSTRKISLTQSSYTITASVVLQGNQHPNIEGIGLYGTTINFSTVTEAAAFSVEGSEQYSGGSLKGITITDPVNSVATSGLIGLVDAGAIGFKFDFAMGTAKRGVLWSDDGNFSEFCSGNIQSPTTCAIAGEYRTTGVQSFHGSGLSGVVNFLAGNCALLIGTGALPYMAPMDLKTFSWDNGAVVDAVAIQNNSGELVPWFVGNFGLERFNTGTVTLGGGNAFLLLGQIGYLGDQSKLAYGSLYLADAIHDSLAGAPIAVLKPVNRKKTVTTNSAVFAMPPTSGGQFEMLIDVGGVGYHYLLQGFLISDDATGYHWTLDNPLLSLDTAAYGDPTVTPGSNILTIAGAWAGASIGVAVTFNQIGQSLNHHDN